MDATRRLGAAVANAKPTVFITGDIFLYDSNALWNNYIPKISKIIVINRWRRNFRILPDTKKVLF
jgi:2-succinyl-5-enolpyruvyl-6-hydroxy-3-cyclohexene-1-carboxylate synthase